MKKYALFLFVLIFGLGILNTSVNPTNAENGGNCTIEGNCLSTQKSILTFTINNIVGNFNGTNISLIVPSGTILTSLVPTIAISANASVSPASGSHVNFTNPVTFTVTAKDGSTEDYIVTVTVAGSGSPPSSPTNLTDCMPGDLFAQSTGFLCGGISAPASGKLEFRIGAQTNETYATYIKVFQQKLKILGYPLTMDGIYGPITASAAASSALASNTINANTTGLMGCLPGETFSTVTGQPCSTATSNLAVGDSFQGDIVAYILQPTDPGYAEGKVQGFLTTQDDQGTSYWGCPGTVVGASGTDIGTGSQNTSDIVSKCSVASNPKGVAARVANDLVLNGYNDWYLPSINELQKLSQNESIIGGFKGDSYWSSSEIDENFAKDMDIGTGNGNVHTNHYKNSSHYIRPIRNFSVNISSASNSSLPPVTPTCSSSQFLDTITNTCIESPAYGSLKIGDRTQCGVVAYILQDGDKNYDKNVQKGLIAAVGDVIGHSSMPINGTAVDVSTEWPWTCSGGSAANCKNANIAATAAMRYQQNGCTDWYLPSIDELKKLYNNRDAIKGFANNDLYWSSSEVDATNAWAQNFSTGGPVSALKTLDYRIRPIMTFPPGSASTATTETSTSCTTSNAVNIETDTLPVGIVGQNYDGKITVSGGAGSGSYVWSLGSTALPPGIAGLPFSAFAGNEAKIIGIPKTPGSYVVNVYINSCDKQASKSFLLNVCNGGSGCSNTAPIGSTGGGVGGGGGGNGRGSGANAQSY